MPRSLIRTDNKRWIVTGRPYPGDRLTERGKLYTLIERATQPQQTSALIDAILSMSGGTIAKRVPSRLVELEREGYIKSNFAADLFT